VENHRLYRAGVHAGVLFALSGNSAYFPVWATGAYRNPRAAESALSRGTVIERRGRRRGAQSGRTRDGNIDAERRNPSLERVGCF